MPQLVLLLSLGFICWLVQQDRKLRHFSSSALWIPAIWLAILGSRSPAQWLHVCGLYAAGPADPESSGNPIDSAYYFAILVASVFVLQRRNLPWGRWISDNKLLVVIYLYFLLSAFWADYGAVTAKRVIKDFANVLVALILLSERNPAEAVRMVFLRVGYFLLPLSIVFIKYFPDIGRTPNRSGSNLFSGVATHKNTLGITVFVVCIVVLLDVIAYHRSRPEIGYTRLHQYVRYGLFATGVWVLLVCDSVTALICLLLGAGLLFSSNILARFQNPGRVVAFVIVGATLAALLEAIFGVAAAVFAMFGRDMTLTGRTEIWEAVLNAPINPLLGTGFYSFWTTEAAQPIIAPFQHLNTAHNGFIETYLDGGLLGLILLVFLILATGWRSIQRVISGSLVGRLSISIWTLSLIYNNSETNFFRPSLLWFSFVLIACRVPNATADFRGLRRVPAFHNESLVESPSPRARRGTHVSRLLRFPLSSYRHAWSPRQSESF